MYQCGLPKEMALELFKPFVMKKLVKGGFAQNWQNPYTAASFTDNGPDALLRQAIRAATGYMHTARNYWCGRITLKNVRSVVGSNVYETGLPCE